MAFARLISVSAIFMRGERSIAMSTASCRETLRGWAMVVAAGMIAITMMAIHRGRMPLRLMLRSLAGKALTMR